MSVIKFAVLLFKHQSIHIHWCNNMSLRGAIGSARGAIGGMFGGTIVGIIGVAIGVAIGDVGLIGNILLYLQLVLTFAIGTWVWKKYPDTIREAIVDLSETFGNMPSWKKKLSKMGLFRAVNYKYNEMMKASDDDTLDKAKEIYYETMRLTRGGRCNVKLDFEQSGLDKYNMKERMVEAMLHRTPEYPDNIRFDSENEHSENEHSSNIINEAVMEKYAGAVNVERVCMPARVPARVYACACACACAYGSACAFARGYMRTRAR